MSQFYAIMRSDSGRAHDVRVDRRVNRSAAERLVKFLNRQAVAEPGLAAPLYYLKLVRTKTHRRDKG